MHLCRTISTSPITEITGMKKGIKVISPSSGKKEEEEDRLRSGPSSVGCYLLFLCLPPLFYLQYKRTHCGKKNSDVGCWERNEPISKAILFLLELRVMRFVYITRAHSPLLTHSMPLRMQKWGKSFQKPCTYSVPIVCFWHRIQWSTVSVIIK